MTARTAPASAGVFVSVETLSVIIDGEPRPKMFVVTTSTGYRAELPACMSDACVGESALLRCVKPRDGRGQHPGQSVDAWCKHIKTHCHSMHIDQAEAFAAKVAASYGSAGRAETTLTGLRCHPKRVDSVSVKAWAEDPYAAALEGRDRKGLS